MFIQVSFDNVLSQIERLYLGVNISRELILAKKKEVAHWNHIPFNDAMAS